MDKVAPQPTQLKINQGTVAQLGTRRIGVVAVVSSPPGATAQLAISPSHGVKQERNDQETKVAVQAGDLLPLDGALYRVEQIIAEEPGPVEGGRPPAPGSRMVVINPTPVQLPGVTLHEGCMIVQLGNTGELHGREFQVERVERQGAQAVVAHLALWPNDYEKENAEAKHEVIRTVVAAGGLLRVGEKEHQVISVVLSDPERHLRGFIELSVRPTR